MHRSCLEPWIRHAFFCQIHCKDVSKKLLHFKSALFSSLRYIELHVWSICIMSLHNNAFSNNKCRLAKLINFPQHCHDALFNRQYFLSIRQIQMTTTLLLINALLWIYTWPYMPIDRKIAYRIIYLVLLHFLNSSRLNSVFLRYPVLNSQS